MQFTFTMGDGDTPEQYRRVIAALVVLGDVSIDAPASLHGVREACDAADAPSPLGYAGTPTPTKESLQAAHLKLIRNGDSLALEIGGGLPGDIAPPSPLEEPDWTPSTPAQILENIAAFEAELKAAKQTPERSVDWKDVPPEELGTQFRDIINTASLGFGTPELAQDRADLDAASSAPPPPSPETDTLLDLDGLPWHADIHAGTKSRIGDGSLRKKPGVSAEQVEVVKAEQRRIAGLAPGAVSAPPPPPGPPAPPAPPVGPPPPPAEEVEPTSATDLLAWAARRNLTRETLNDACQRIGLVDANGNGSLSLIMQKAEFVGPLYRELRS